MITHLRSVQPMGALLWVVGFTVLSFWSLRLKKIHLSSDRLYVSDYLRRVSIATKQISGVEPSSWGYPRTITLTFDEPTIFGSEVIFIPLGVGLFASDVANEIRAAQHAA